MNKTILLVLLAVGMVMSGCEEAQQQKVWGQGELPADWQGFFGKSNTARLDFVQTQAIDRQAAMIYGIDAKDSDGQVIHKRGLIERVITLEERVKKLEAECIETGDKVNIIGKRGWYKKDTEVVISKTDPNS